MPFSPAPQNAEPPRAPALTAAGLRLRAEREARRRSRAQREHFSMMRGLLWMAFVILLVSIARAGLGRAFVPGWWRQW